jgi:hypothetical protein
MFAFATLRAESTLADDCERVLEVVLIAPSKASTLDEEFERLRLEVWFVEILLLVASSATSTLDDDDDSERDDTLAALSAASTLEDESDRLTLDV